MLELTVRRRRNGTQKKYTPGMPRTDDIIHRDSIPVLADRRIVEVTGRWYQMKCRLLRRFPSLGVDYVARVPR